MKKYLMTGVAALAFAATFTSCSKSNDLYEEGAQIKDSYEAAFINAFGKPASNQDWGFGSSASSRAMTRTLVNVNGNLWEECPGLLTASETGAGKDEKTLVYDFVNMTLAQMKANNHNYYTDLPDNYHNFFVTHVYTGTTKYNTYQDRNNTDESKMVTGSAQMNNLQIGETDEAVIDKNTGAKSGTWYHCNNFNAGNNTDWGGNTLFEESGTCDFAYHSSSDSKYHNRWIAVKGEEIHPSLAGKYYICFDFIAEPTNPKTEFKVWVNEAGVQDGSKHHQTNISVDGIWSSAQNLLDAGITSVVYNNVTYTVDASADTGWEYANMTNPNMAIPSDNTYTDWIIRIVPAVAKAETYDYRIMAEDLSASDNSDFDFNDIVFDIKYNEAGTACKIRIVAAGGTLPLTIAGQEVHGLFQEANPGKTITTKTMINTINKTEYAYAYLENIASSKSTKGKDIALSVTKEDGNTYPLEAKQGVPACKICVNPNVDWQVEFTNINKRYPKFDKWVKNVNVAWYAEDGSPVADD